MNVVNEKLSDNLNLSESQALAVFLDVSFALNTVLMPIVIYFIFKVKTIGKYRWYILNGIVWDYLHDVVLALWKPVTFLPVTAIYSDVSDTIPYA